MSHRDVPSSGSLASQSPCVLTREPIAIVGIGCRFPGDVNSPQAFWKLLQDGTDALIDIPPDRWSLDLYYDPDPGKPGRTNIRHGGFVKGIDLFDAPFFGISPREAAFLDPQQRLLLEVAWEALEDGGQALERLWGSSTGVFVGISSFDYSLVQTSYPDRQAIDVYTNTGGALSIAANRISYCFNFKGPSAAVDTACSSSLYALHVACESLWQGGCQQALVGGVHVLLSPGPYIGFSRLAMLSSDGRCKAFDARANGFVRSEGAGMVVLKPLSAARADGDRIYALVRGTAINQDGRTTGLTVPSQSSQEELIRDACRRAGVTPGRVQFVETHGTGTPVGDPIEARALGAALSEGRPADSPCLLGAVKTNIGHLEAASGIAGLIKAVLSLYHRQVPPNLHFQQPSAEIPFEHLRLRVPTTLEPWPGTDGPALAGVNSFGFGGTNAHAVLESFGPAVNGAPIESELAGTGLPRAEILPLSARTAQALPAVARTFKDFLAGEGAGLSLGLLCRSAALRRTHHEHRLAVIAHSPAELAERLQGYLDGNPQMACVSDRVVPNQQPHLAFVYSGQGPQWWGMGRELLEQEPVFRDVLHRCDEVIRSLGDWSLLHELSADEAHSRMHVTAISQPAIFSLQAGLTALWQSWGIRPDAVVGHSVGEVAAAWAAGVLELEEAVRVIYQRGRCMELAPARGRMLAVALTVEQALEHVARSEGRIALAAINSPTSLTLSGDGAALEEVAQDLQARQIFCRFLQVQYAFHSYQMDPVRDELLASLQGLQPRQAVLPLFSTVTGQQMQGSEMGPDYWWQNVRQTVRFADGVDRLIDSGMDMAIEVSPHPVLASSIDECYRHRSKKARVVVSLRRHEEERATLLRGLAQLHTADRPIDWAAVVPEGKDWVRLPTYPWQRESYWHESEESRQSRVGSTGHPLLWGKRPTPQPSWETSIDTRLLPHLADHRVQGHVLVSSAAYIEMVLGAAKETLGGGAYVLEDVRLLKGCFLPDGQTRKLQTIYRPEEGVFEISSRPESGSTTWTTHVRGYLRSWHEKEADAELLSQVRARCPKEVAGDRCYADFSRMGVDYGPTFRGLTRLWYGQGEGFGEVQAPQEIVPELGKYVFHPALLDACLQAAAGALSQDNPSAGSERGISLPVEIEQVRFYTAPGQHLWSHARLVERNRVGTITDVCIYNDTGELVCEVLGLHCRSVGEDGLTQTLDDLLYQYEWRFQPRAGQELAHRSLDFLTSLDPICKGAESLVRHGARELRQRYGAMEPALDRLSALYAWGALRDLGWECRPGERFSTEALAERLRVAPQHHRVLGRYLTMLAEDGVLARDGATWHVERVPEMEDPQPLWQQLLAGNPAFFAELTMVRRCALQLAPILRGEVNPLQVIFPDGSLATAEHLYQDSPSVRFYNSVAQRAISLALKQWPAGRTVRILEIGAGTGGLTSFVLPILPADRTQYVFTDLSNHFFIKAEQKFKDYPFLQYQKLDIEKSPEDQGFAPHSFDLVLASQVLHATADLRQTLSNARRLLASGGLLVFLELVEPARWIDLVFGLTEGWWRFTDRDLRTDYPLLPFPKWQALLHEVGYVEVADVSGSRAEGGLASAVVMARGPQLDTPVAPSARMSAAADGPESWLLFADQGTVATELAAILQSRGQRCVLAHAGDAFAQPGPDQYTLRPGQFDDVQQLLRSFLGNDPERRTGVIYLWGLDGPDPATATTSAIEQAQVSGCWSVVQLVQAWNEAATTQSAPLFLVTRGTQTVGTELASVTPVPAPLWGLGRVVCNEFPRLRTRRIDLGTASREELLSLVDELAVEDGEDEIALRGEARYVHRYVHTSLDEQGRQALRSSAARTTTVEQQDDSPVPACQPYRLEVSRSGVLDGLALRSASRPEPGHGMVEVRVLAAGLNFSDVMKALGLYPGLPDGPVPLGIECAGIVSAVGEGVENLHVGDAVVAIAPFSFGAYVLTHARFVSAKPDGITFEEAATLPIAFLTAAYALEHLGQLSRGEKVLIHAAAGGVGLAAIQLARRAGAEVFATAGSPEKRQLLEAMGIEHVMDSRSLAFADEVMERTGGRGVDVVLNSLSGEAIAHSLALLTDHGRFLELGKRDIYQNTRVGLRPFRKNLSFHVIDLDGMMRKRPALLADLFQQQMKEVRAGSLSPLPLRIFSISNVVNAFRHMSQARHIGKVVLSLREQPELTAAARSPLVLRSDATYLIVGGLGGFGLTVARWMVERGARHLVLMGRSGAATPEARQAVAVMEQAGASIVVARADVTVPEQLAAVLADVKRSMPPLRGILQAAMVLEDCLLLKLDSERMERVLRPKVNGSWNLHLQTRDYPLDFFVLFSSMASQFGLPGQASYSSANAFQDALAYHRRACGLPGLAINWGYLANVGYVARNEKTAERLEGLGLKSFTPAQALNLLDGLMQQGAVQVGVANIDWGQWQGLGGPGAGSPRFSCLTQEVASGGGERWHEDVEVRKVVLAAPPERRMELLVSFLRERVAWVLGASADKIDVDKPLTDVGLDSLMAVELRNWIEGSLRVTLPIVELMQGPTVTRVAEILLAQMTRDEGPAAAQPGVQPPVHEEAAVNGNGQAPAAEKKGIDKETAGHLLEQMEVMSDAEVDNLLQTMLAENKLTEEV